MEKGRIIFLNGVTSAGKTSIVESLQYQEDIFFMLLRMTYFRKWLEKIIYIKNYWKYLSEVIIMMYHTAKLYSDMGKNVLIDGILVEREEIKPHYHQLLEILKNNPFDIAGYSKFHFLRMFKAYTDAAISEYVCRRRLIKASEDIIAGNKIIDVAMKYGWQTHSGFTRSFNREFGFCPSLLRAMIIEIDSFGGGTMSHVFLESTKEELLELLQNQLQANGISIGTEKLMKVYDCACRAYYDVKRYSGEEYVTHTINVAIILAELGAEANIILAGMLCDIGKKGSILREEIRKCLPKDIYEIVEEVQDTDNNLTQSSNNVMLIKLAERLHNMRTVEFMDEGERQCKAKETIEIFMPLARKFNNQKLIDELNNLSMKYYNNNSEVRSIK